MKVTKTELAGVVVIEPKIFGDHRGTFFESYNKRKFAEHGIEADFVQDNQSSSTFGVLRGLHFQKGEHAQAKLVRVLSGKVLDVAVDIREGSSTYGKWVAAELSCENKRQMFVPRGFAHGFVVLSETVQFAYKCDNYYCQVAEGGIRYDDPELAIDWQVDSEDIVVSEKDEIHDSFELIKELVM